MIQCPRCGSHVNDDASSCPRCGLVRVVAPVPASPPPTRSSRPWWVGLLTGGAAVLLAAAIVAGGIWFTQRDGTTAAPDRTPTAPTVATPSPSVTASPTDRYEDFADVYASIGSGVGQVDVETCDGSGTGSGFLIGPRRLVTSAHVVNGSSEITVQMDGATLGASIEGVDKSIDLAVLRLDERSNGHVFDLSEGPVRTGTRLAVIGFPLGQPKTLTEGTVSGSGRGIETRSGTLTDMLQTDTALNPGNSGGPLVNIAGDVVGVADAVRTDAQGIGYAVPSSTVTDTVSRRGALTPVNTIKCGVGAAVPETALSVLYAYHQAINAADYDEAMGALTGEFAGANFTDRRAWHGAYETTYDDQLEIVDAAYTADQVLVRMRFRSQQAPGYGPQGARNARCLRWDVDYRLAREHDAWLIAGASGHGDPAWSRC